jgi:membrane-bound lytic murein transglycosylase A
MIAQWISLFAIAIATLVLLAIGPGGSTSTAQMSRPPEGACPPMACPSCQVCPVCPVCPADASIPPPAKTLQAAAFAELPNWANDDHSAALAAFLRGCRALERRNGWKDSCEAASRTGPSRAEARAFFEKRFKVYRVTNADGTVEGLMTGYYEPILRGSRKRVGPFNHPLHAPPDDLISVDLASVVPEAANLRLRGRIEGKKIVPYFTRSEIEQQQGKFAARTLLWIDDPIELFFLHVQGSGRIDLGGGEMVRVGFADQNGHPYRSIGRYLVDRGELKLEQASMQGIQGWARANRGRINELLGHNPSYVFFREVSTSDLPLELGARGALGAPLSPGRSIAIDPRFITLGAPVFLATAHPSTGGAIEQLMVAQDTGGAIRGAVRADYYWGFGSAAGQEAGRMRSQGRMWMLLPNEIEIGG